VLVGEEAGLSVPICCRGDRGREGGYERRRRRLAHLGTRKRRGVACSRWRRQGICHMITRDNRRLGYLIPVGTLELQFSACKWVAPNSNHRQTVETSSLRLILSHSSGLRPPIWPPTSLLSPSCSRPAWTLDRTSKVRHVLFTAVPLCGAASSTSQGGLRILLESLKAYGVSF
jgi:hypothetical protein